MIKDEGAGDGKMYVIYFTKRNTKNSFKILGSLYEFC
jgi:hypothetical protein